ncbi:MAG: extracellular solute-binding protein [Defluviitaleaceae bacterium]|nr:extracellular solute-binding protein [Defluviitaleaceae bacterium]
MKAVRSRKKGIAIIGIVIVLVLAFIIVFPTGGAIHANVDSFPSVRPYTIGDEVARVDLGEVVWDIYYRGVISYDVQVPAAGNYMLVFTYRAVTDTVQPMEILVTIGDVSHVVALEQSYVFDQFPFAYDERGDERRPRLIKNMNWMSMPAYRADGGQSTPIIFPMTAGNNTITIESIGGVVSLKDVAVMAAMHIPDYTTYRAHTPGSYAVGHVVITESQNVAAISTRTIQLHSLSEAGLSPETFGRTTFNAIGGVSWQHTGQWVEWVVTVPEAGFYNIAFKYQQNLNPALHSFRRVEVNGHIPFAELLNVPFPFSANWSNLVLGGDEPFMIYLNAGENIIRLTGTNEPYFEVYESLISISEDIRVLDIYIRGITGVFTDRQVDSHRIFQLERYIPDLDERLANIALAIEYQMSILSDITGTPMARFDLLRQEVRNLNRFANNLDLLTNSYDTLLRSQTSVASFAVSLLEQPLLFDTIMATPPGEDFPRARASAAQTASFMTRQLVSSFTDDRGTVAVRDPEVLQVWVQRGRDYINLMQQHANEFFTPYSGIEVTMNFIPGPDLLILANAAGTQPSVVSGIGRDVPFNFALRNALVPLSQFEGFDALMDTVPPGAMVPYYFEREMFALPEELIFNVLFFRRDIFEDYNLAPPSTWDDAKRVVSTLQQNNMNFWIAWGDWLTFYYQFGVAAYTLDGLDLALDSEEGFQVFRYWSELYTRFNFPHRIGSFYQSFRRGHIPVGVSSLQDYFFLRLAAPELAGLWGIAPVPGIVNDDGINIRWQSGDQRAVALFRTDEQREAAGWEFIRWWMDTETQTNFALDLEFSLGQEFRWFSANPEVVAAIPWDENDRRTIMTQMEWFKGIPFAPGGSYLLEREMRNALSDVVLDGRNYRDMLHGAARAVRQEMNRVQRQFNIIDDYGNVLRPLSMLEVPLPEIAVPMEVLHD